MEGKNKFPYKNPDRNQGKIKPNGTIDKNDPMNYVGGKFLEEDGYLNNVTTELNEKPRNYPFRDAWKQLKGSSYHKKTWVPLDKRRDDNKAKRRLERDPNHPQWESRFGLLRWWRIKIQLLGTDPGGNQMVCIRLGEGEPIYLRFGKTITVYKDGRELK